MDVTAERQELRRLINGFQSSQVLHALTVLGIPDLLGRSRRGAADLAEAAGCNPPALYRLLRAAAALGVLDEDRSQGFALTPFGEGLRSDAAGSLAGWAELIGTPNFWQNWGQLVDSVRTGETGWRLRHGVDAWTYRAQHPEEGRVFDRAMVSITGTHVDALAGSYDFSRFRTIVDVGGGRGALLARILRDNPGSTGVLFDQPHVVETAAGLLREQGVSDRCRVEGGSFFESVPGGGDAYLLKSVLHDWYDPEARRILETCRKATAPGAVLLVIENVLEPPNQGPETKLGDINMLVGPGGQERTVDEFAALLASAGFTLGKVVDSGGLHSLLEAAPA